MKAFTGRFAGLMAVVALLLSGCDNLTGPGLTDTGSISNSSSTGKVKVLLTDAPFPFDLVDSANVEIVRVELLSQEEGAMTVSQDTQAFNLLELRNGVTAPLGEVEVPEGTYEQIRLIVAEDASVVMKDGTTYDLKVPSGTETGIKVLTGGMKVDSETLTSITLDFAVDESFVVKGNPNSPAGIKGFNFKPVIKLEDLTSEEAPEDEDESAEQEEGEQTDDGAGDEEDDGTADEQTLNGTVNEVGADFVTVGETKFTVNEETVLEGFDQLADLAIDNEVDVTYVEREDGTRLATSIALTTETEAGDAEEEQVSEEDGSSDAESGV